jgi:phosphatidylethanolamine-binding protein (PEBP) family uncharacterized protein
MHPLEVLLTPLGKAFRNRSADESKSLSLAAELATPTHFTLSSPAFADGAEIPAKYCGWLIGENVSPALTWSTLPSGTVDLVLFVEDLNSPGAEPRVHGLAEFVPAEGGLPEGTLVAGASGVTYVPGPRGPLKYAGPRPLPGHGPHHYRFHLYALDTHIDLSTVANAQAFPAALAGHVLGSAALTGTRES